MPFQQTVTLHKKAKAAITTNIYGNIVAIGCPGEGHNESCMQMRKQGPDCFQRRAIAGFCEAVLPVPRCNVRAHLGSKLDVLTYAKPLRSVIRKNVVRSFEGYAQGETAGAVRSAWRCLRRLESASREGRRMLSVLCQEGYSMSEGSAK